MVQTKLKTARIVVWCCLRVLAPVLACLTSSVSMAANLTEKDVRRDIGYVRMADGTRISYISYRPKLGRYPTVFQYSPYAGASTPFGIAKEFLDAGYAYVGANLPGTGCSEGVVDHWVDGFDHKAGRYGAEVIEWIAEQPWSDAKVGMIGNSSDGTIQFWVAAERPPHLRAIVASGVEDGYQNWLHLGGMLQLNATMAYEMNTEIVTQARGADWRISQGDTQCSAIRASEKQRLRLSFSDEVRKHPLKDAWWDAAYLARAEVAGKVNVPTMIIAGWQDEYGGAARESGRVFSELLKNTPHKRLVLMNGNHAIGGPGPNGYGIVDRERMTFLKRWLQGDGVEPESQLPVTIYWEVQEPRGDPKAAVAGWVTQHSSWPEPKVERRRLFLTADAKIAPDTALSGSMEGSRAYLYPTGTELAGDNQQFALLPYSNGVLNYRTEPAVSDIALLGNPEVTLYFSIDNGDDTDFELTLKDVDPGGNVLFLQSGLLRASLREVDESRSSVDEVVPTYRKSEKLTPGQIYQIRMSLLSPIAHVVRRGHSLELTIGAPNPIPDRAIGSFPAGASSINRVYHSAKYPSQILLPILPGVVPKGPAPECGTLRGQPCRTDVTFVTGGLPIQ